VRFLIYAIAAKQAGQTPVGTKEFQTVAKRRVEKKGPQKIMRFWDTFQPRALNFGK
jgi:hypothetical protein